MEMQSPYTMVFFAQVIIRLVFIMTTLHRKLAKLLFFFFVFQMILVLHMLFLSLSWTSVMLCLMCLQILLFIDFSIVRLQLLKYTQKKKHICNLLSLYSSVPEKIGIQHEILWGDLTKSIASTPVYLEDFFFFFFHTEISQCSAFGGKSGLCVFSVLSSKIAGAEDFSNAASQMNCSSRKCILCKLALLNLKRNCKYIVVFSKLSQSYQYSRDLLVNCFSAKIGGEDPL